MNWDDVSTQIRTLVDAVPPVEADEARHHRTAVDLTGPARRPGSGPTWRKPTLAAAATILVAAAVWTATTSSGDDPGHDVATGSTDTTDATAGPQSIGDTGPLALLHLPLSMQAEGRGTLEITDECTFLRTFDERILLAWPVHRTSWVPESGTIRVEGLDGDPAVELADGDDVRLPGGGLSLNGPNEGRFDWVAEPSPSCGDEAWFVGGPVKVDP